MSPSNTPFRIVKAKSPGMPLFVDFVDPDALDTFRAQHGNRDLLVSVAFYESPDPSSRCLYALCFHVRSSSLEQARQSALEVVYYLAENCGIPPESLDLTFNGGGIVAEDDRGANAGTAAPAEIVILVPPVVFDGQATPLAAALNYDLAYQMRQDGIENLDIDCYVRDHFAPLRDSICEATGRFSVRVSPRELLYLGHRILNLVNEQRGDDWLITGHSVPEAAEWYAEALVEKEKQVRRQAQLRDKLLGRWVVPPCVRRLDWADVSEDSALAACRIIAGFYPFIGAGEDEVWYHIHRVSKRHGLQPGIRLRATVTFGNENPAFVGCEHPLLRQLCPTGGCFMKEAIDEIANPRLFA